MSVDIIDLREFYSSPLGKVAQSALNRSIKSIDTIPDSSELVGLGYPVPIFDELAYNNKAAIILMPGNQGALQWPAGKNCRTALVDEEELPLTSASVEVVIVLHLLENVANPALVLDEIWRILVPEGRLVLVATNRRGIWSRFEHTPFGNGRPFSKGQLEKLLRKAKLTPAKWERSLNFPPVRNKSLISLYPIIDKIGHRLWPVFCGAFVVTATKRLYQGVPVKSKKSSRVTAPILSPQSGRNITKASIGNKTDSFL